MSRTRYTVYLGLGWTRFAEPRPDFQFLGRVQRGQAFGALARLSDGTYAQVNGDVVTPLSQRAAQRAVRHASKVVGRAVRGAVDDPVVAEAKPAPVVTVKKRRIVCAPVS